MNDCCALNNTRNMNKRPVRGFVTAAFAIVLSLFSFTFGDATEPNSTDEILIVTGSKQCVEFTDADLDRWKSKGVDGFICNITWLRPFGGTQNYTGDSNANLTSADYDTQRQFL